MLKFIEAIKNKEKHRKTVIDNFLSYTKLPFKSEIYIDVYSTEKCYINIEIPKGKITIKLNFFECKILLFYISIFMNRKPNQYFKKKSYEFKLSELSTIQTDLIQILRMYLRMYVNESSLKEKDEYHIGFLKNYIGNCLYDVEKTTIYNRI